MRTNGLKRPWLQSTRSATSRPHRWMIFTCLGLAQGCMDADVSQQTPRRRHSCHRGEFGSRSNPDQSLSPLQNALPERIAGIRETPNNVSVRGSVVQPGGRTKRLHVGCFVFDPPRFNTLFTALPIALSAPLGRNGVIVAVCSGLIYAYATVKVVAVRVDCAAFGNLCEPLRRWGQRG